jgi:dTDP-glucose 4,6-dehydratase
MQPSWLDLTGRRILVTGGAGFIGSAVVRHFVRDLGANVLVVDKLTFAGSLSLLARAVSQRPALDP